MKDGFCPQNVYSLVGHALWKLQLQPCSNRNKPCKARVWLVAVCHTTDSVTDNINHTICIDTNDEDASDANDNNASIQVDFDSFYV